MLREFSSAARPRCRVPLIAVGLVLSIVAYIISRRAGFQNSKALAGIIVGAAYLVIGLILQLTMGLISGIFQMTG